MEAQQKIKNPNRVYWSKFLALISSKEWQANHPTNKAGFHRMNCQRFIVGTNDRPVGKVVLDKQFFLTNFVEMVNAAVSADPSIQVAEENIKWAVDAISTHDTLSLALVWTLSVTPPHYLTPAEVAAATGTAESSWRNKCAAGQIEGAVKKGKRWLIPDYALIKQHVAEVGRPTKSNWQGGEIRYQGFDRLPEHWTDDQYQELNRDVNRRVKFVAQMIEGSVKVEQRDIRPGESIRVAVRPDAPGTGANEVYVYLLAGDNVVSEWDEHARDEAVNRAVEMLL